MAQLVERLLRISEVRGLNPVMGKNLYCTFTINCIEKTKTKKKRPGMDPFFFKKKNNYLSSVSGSIFAMKTVATVLHFVAVEESVVDVIKLFLEEI